jgi:putative methyltransferase (TIGR04325 family)
VLDRLHPYNAFRGVYATFREAERAAPETKPVGYDAAGAATWFADRLQVVQLQDYPVLFWLRSAFAECRTLLEIGGHVGVAYYGFERFLHYPPGLSWTIFDVPTVVVAGQTLARQRGRTNVRFISTLTETTGAEILLAAGALQYLDATFLIDSIAAFQIRPQHVFLNAMPVYEGPAFFTLQNIGNVYCPYRVFNRTELVNALEALGYRLIDSWREVRDFRVPGYADRSFKEYSGFYFRLA